MDTITATRLWHPFADMGSVGSAELEIVRGDDVWVFDASGRRYLDGTAALWYCNVGHGRTEIADAVRRQMGELASYSAFGDFVSPPARALTERLADLAPVDDARIFLGSGGGDGIDTAAKLARRFWVESGEPQRHVLVSRSQGYHGTHGIGTALGGIPANRAGYGELDPDARQVPMHDLAAVDRLFAEVGPDRIAAVFVEPVIGAGGVHPPEPGELEGLAARCRAAGALLVIDSVICGFGRLGTWFGIERWDVEPDMIVFAKGVTSGYLPLGGVVVAPRVWAPFFAAPGGPMFRHGATYAGHAACCAAALANLDILEGEDLLSRGRDLEDALAGALRSAADASPKAAGVRGGTGTMAALVLDPELLAADPTAPARLGRAARDRGVLVRPLGDAVACSPPLTATPDHFGVIADALEGALATL